MLFQLTHVTMKFLTYDGSKSTSNVEDHSSIDIRWERGGGLHLIPTEMLMIGEND